MSVFYNRLACLLLALAMLLPGLAGAADTAPASLDRLVVVGSPLQSRSALDSPVPVDVFQREELLAAAPVGNELGQALAILAPSFNFPRQSNSVTSDHVRSAQLRGMSPDQVLVLVNGKRRHPSAVVNDNTKIGRGTNAVDFNTIPLTAVKRVEILRDGASAQYGSDAIAGVINIVLDDSGSGGRAGASFGLHHTHPDALDRTITDGETFTAYLNQGFSWGERGFLRAGVEYFDRNATNRAGRDNVPPAFAVPQTEANLALRGRVTHRVGDPDTEDFKFWFNAGAALGPGEWYGRGTYAMRDSRGAAVFRYPDDDQNVPAVFPDGFLPETTGDNQDVSLTLGARLPAAAWTLDQSVTGGRNEFEFGVDNSLNPSLGPASPTSFDSGTFTFDQINLNLAVERGGLPTPIAPLDLAVGVDYRYERFDSDPGDPASFAAGDFRFEPELEALVGLPDIGAQGAKGLTPADATTVDRHVVAGHVDLAAQLSDRLYTSLAGRVEHYSDFGTTATGKLAMSYDVGGAVKLRGSVSNSFRAPSLSQLGWARRTNSFGPEGERISARLVRPESAIAVALGAQPLDEENSFNASAGLTAELLPGLDLSVDLFRIAVDDRITLSEFLEDDGSGDTSLQELIRELPGGENVESVAFFTNAVDARTQGVEAVLTYNRALGGGVLNATAAYSLADTEITAIDAPPAELQAINPGLSLVGVEEINTIETATPEDKFTATATYDRGDWRLLGRVRHFGSAERVFSFARQTFGPESAIDIEIGYRLMPALEWTVGSRNLLDNFPDPSNPANNFFGNFAFDVLSPIGINGRYLYTSLDWSYQ